MAESIKASAVVGLPVYVFGSPELAALHEAALDPPHRIATRPDGRFYNPLTMEWLARGTYAVESRVYGASHDGYRYVVDHGGFRTLNTLWRGQRVPESKPIEEEA